MPWPTAFNSFALPLGAFTSPAVAVLLPVGIGSFVGYSVSKVSNTKQTYTALRQPPLNPPAWLFGPVWTALYGLMGYAAYRVSNIGLRSFSLSTRELTTSAQALYTVSLALNFAWMPLFFGLRKPVSAMVDIVALLGCVGTLTRWYGEIDRVAAFCMLPYLAWVGFATYLTVGVGIRNGWNIDGAVNRAQAKRKD